MQNLKNCSNIFIDFDGVIVDSNGFKEKAIKKSIFKIKGKDNHSLEAINYFNINAGISRKRKLSLFFNDQDVSEIMKKYSYSCKSFFSEAHPTIGLKEFLEYININHRAIKMFVLSGGEIEEIKLFLKKHNLLAYFEDILSSNLPKIEHLKNKGASENDIFIGDSKNDLEASLNCNVKFILFEKYKSLKSFPKEELIKNKVFLRVENFKSLLKKIIE